MACKYNFSTDDKFLRRENLKKLRNSNIPIYKQIAAQFKENIINGEIAEGELLPSIRGLAQDLKISVITTMKAYKQLEDEGWIFAVRGKGHIVNQQDREVVREHHLRQLEQHLQEAIDYAKLVGISQEELIKMISVLYNVLAMKKEKKKNEEDRLKKQKGLRKSSATE